MFCYCKGENTDVVLPVPQLVASRSPLLWGSWSAGSTPLRAGRSPGPAARWHYWPLKIHTKKHISRSKAEHRRFRWPWLMPNNRCISRHIDCDPIRGNSTLLDRTLVLFRHCSSSVLWKRGQTRWTKDDWARVTACSACAFCLLG